MNIAIYGKVSTDAEDRKLIKDLIDTLSYSFKEIKVWEKFFKTIEKDISRTDNITLFNNKEDLQDVDILLSLGGDGTMLDTVNYVIGTSIAVLGVNLGHLGFLTTAGRDTIKNLPDQIKANNFTIENRSILQTEYSFNIENVRQFAANEVCFLSCNRGSIVDLEVSVNDKYLSTYSGDGVIIATPTGSTAYSMSCGGAIITPESPCISITPVAPHNLTFRPIIISDNDVIKVHIPKSDDNCKMLVDGYNIFETTDCDVIIKKSPYKWNLVRLENQDFFDAIRKKLMWGTTPKYLTGNL